MKARIGVDSETGIVHSMTTTAANAHDVTEARKLLRGGEKIAYDTESHIQPASRMGEL